VISAKPLKFDRQAVRRTEATSHVDCDHI